MTLLADCLFWVYHQECFFLCAWDVLFGITGCDCEFLSLFEATFASHKILSLQFDAISEVIKLCTLLLIVSNMVISRHHRLSISRLTPQNIQNKLLFSITIRLIYFGTHHVANSKTNRTCIQVLFKYEIS